MLFIDDIRAANIATQVCLLAAAWLPWRCSLSHLIRVGVAVARAVAWFGISASRLAYMQILRANDFEEKF